MFRLHREHLALDRHERPDIDTTDIEVPYAGTADKIVALASLLGRSAAAPDPDRFWAARQAFTRRLDHLPRLPPGRRTQLPPAMAGELRRVLALTETAATGRPAPTTVTGPARPARGGDTDPATTSRDQS